MTIGVVGAGITGLALTHHLGERGADAVAFEADAEPGGVVRSERVDGRVLERGPQRVRLTDEVRALVDALGLGDDLLVANDDLPLWVYADGRLREVPRSLSTFVATDLLSWQGKLRLLAEPFTRAGRPDETAAELFARKFGREAYENLVGPLFGGIYASDPARMPAKYALDGLLRLERREGSFLKPALRRVLGSRETPPPVSFRDGLQALPEALYDANADHVRLSEPVRRVREDGRGFALLTESGETRVDEVVLTTPADVTGRVLADLAPTSADRLARLSYNPLALVYLDARPGRDGMGYQVRRDEPLETLGVSWNASLFGRDGGPASDASGTSSRPTGRDGVHTAFLGGMDRPRILDKPDDALGRIAADEFQQITGAHADVVGVHRLDRGFPAYDGSWAALDEVDLPDGIRLATNYTGRMGVPSRIREAKRLAGELAE
jgi:oxygen-dependent protoporphyrinogen oxidase